jgi:hypothetical protein
VRSPLADVTRWRCFVIAILQAVIGDMISLVAVAAVIGGLIKLFQMSATLTEIKDVLLEIRRDSRELSSAQRPTPVRVPNRPIARQSGDEALQAALMEQDR